MGASHGVMKVQKTVSLDAQTAKIAEDMGNFSMFCRVALLAYDQGNDFATMQRLARVWMRTANLLRDALARATDDDRANEAMIQAMNAAKSQTEFEVE